MDRRNGVEKLIVRHETCVPEEDERHECGSGIRRERRARDHNMWRHSMIYLVRILFVFLAQHQGERAQCSKQCGRDGREKNETMVHAYVHEAQYERLGSVATAGWQCGVLLLLVVWFPGDARHE